MSPLLDTKSGGFPSLSHLVLGLISICRDAFRVPGAAFFSHFDRIDALTIWTFSDDLMLWGWPGGFRFNVDPVARMFETHSRIVFRSGTGAQHVDQVWSADGMLFVSLPQIHCSWKTFRQRNHGARPSNLYPFTTFTVDFNCRTVGRTLYPFISCSLFSLALSIGKT